MSSLCFVEEPVHKSSIDFSLLSIYVICHIKMVGDSNDRKQLWTLGTRKHKHLKLWIVYSWCTHENLLYFMRILMRSRLGRPAISARKHCMNLSILFSTSKQRTSVQLLPFKRWDLIIWSICGIYLKAGNCVEVIVPEPCCTRWDCLCSHGSVWLALVMAAGEWTVEIVCGGW